MEAVWNCYRFESIQTYIV